MKVRHITDADWGHVVALETGAYASALSENLSALQSKNRVSPSTCFVLEVGGRVAGYLLSLPYPRFQYPGLAQTEKVVHRSRNLHLHDLVIGERFRGMGLAKRLLRELTATAGSKNYRWISLVAVAGSESFWLTQGYDPCPEVTLPSNYGADAVYMSRAV